MPGGKQEIRHWRPRFARIGMARFVTVAARVGQPAERTAIGHFHGHRPAALQVRCVQRRLVDDLSQDRGCGFLMAATEVSRYDTKTKHVRPKFWSLPLQNPAKLCMNIEEAANFPCWNRSAKVDALRRPSISGRRSTRAAKLVPTITGCHSLLRTLRTISATFQRAASIGVPRLRGLESRKRKS